MKTLHGKINKYFDEMFSCPDSDLYHYTKKGNEIIRSSFFKLKPHHDLNKQDNGELIIGTELTKKYLKKSNLAQFEPTLNKFLESGVTMHIGSFSREHQNKHAIEKYGPDCLEFKDAFFKKLPNEYNALVGSVEYNPKTQNEIISTIFDLYNEPTDEHPTEKHCSLFLWIHIISTLLKHQKHQPDSESRIITASGKEKNNPKKIITTTKDRIKFTDDEVTLLKPASKKNS